MLSIVVPCYNEEMNIPHIVEAFSKCIANRKDVEVILVNNGSKDNSKIVLEKILQQDKQGFFRVAEVKENKGYGFGILAGLKEAKGDVLAWTHADLQTDPSDVLTAYDKYLSINDKNVFIKGSRTDRQFHAWFFSWGMQVLASLILGENLKEINAQPKVLSRNFYNDHLRQNAPHDFSLDLYAYYWAIKTCRIEEIPVIVRKRKFGEAKGGGSIKTKIKLIKRSFQYILKFRKELKQDKRLLKKNVLITG
jgi:glycosyltransferase involved in cell wall biosynthesis